jgi:magnesium-transporting ATPase (P-type)
LPRTRPWGPALDALVRHAGHAGHRARAGGGDRAGTEIGRIGGLLAGVEQLTTPLVAQMDHFARWLSFLILLVSGLLLAYGYFVGHQDFSALFMAVVGVAVAAIPEGLPAVMTITLAIGVQAMARRNAIVRRLPAIEAIGSVAVICTDKTGTLTRNEMVVAAAETPAGAFEITGQGYAPVKARSRLPGTFRASRWRRPSATTPRCGMRGGQWSVEGDPMEGALLAFAGKVGRRQPGGGSMPFPSTAATASWPC